MNDLRETDRESVDHCPLFQGLSDDDRAAVLARLEPLSYAEGDAIYSEGDSRQQMSIIVRGRCEVVKRENGDERQLAVLEPPNVFGELSFFHAAPHSATVRALTEMDIVALSRANYDELLAEVPLAAHAIAVNTIKLVSDRLRSMDEWVFELLDKPANAVHKEEWEEFRAKLYTDWQF